jgi:hypothetical protein
LPAETHYEGQRLRASEILPPPPDAPPRSISAESARHDDMIVNLVLEAVAAAVIGLPQTHKHTHIHTHTHTHTVCVCLCVCMCVYTNEYIR